MDKFIDIRNLVSLAAFCCLSGCGGGGGADGATAVQTPPVVIVPPVTPAPAVPVPVPDTPSAPVTPVPPVQPQPISPVAPPVPVIYPALSYQPSRLVEVMQVGESRVSQLQITLSSPPPEPLYFRIVDPLATLKVTSTVTKLNDLSYTAVIVIPATLPHGIYEGDLVVQVCRDAACTQLVPYSRQLLRYSVSNLLTVPVSFVDPVNISRSFYTGQSGTVNALLGTPYEYFKRTLFITASDPKGVFVSTSDFIPYGDNVYEFTLTTSPTLTTGHYAGSVEIRACVDKDCSAAYPVTTMSLPYTVDVKALSTLTALTRWPGVADWQNARRNAERSSYVPVTLDVSKFSRRWKSVVPGIDSYTIPIVISADHVFVTSGRTLYALKESDGSVDWRRDFDIGYPYNPTGSGDMVYVEMGSGNGSYTLHGLNAYTGKTGWSSTSLIPADYMQPLLSSGKLLHAISQGGNSGVQAVDPLNGAPLWFARMKSPAVQGNTMFSFDQGLAVADAATGTLQKKIATDALIWNGRQYPYYLEPVAGAAGSVFGITRVDNINTPKSLVNFNLAQNKVAWSKTGNYGDNFAYAEGVVYVINESTLMLEARAESDGALLWDWKVPSTQLAIGGTDILVTKNLVFVSYNQFTYALDLVTHKVVWQEPGAGLLSMSSNGVLYIGGRSGSVTGYNVK